MNISKSQTVVACLFAVTLCGCGPSAKQMAEQQAEQQARQNFRNAVAAMRVCTQGSTYNEFREKWLALETCYTANQSFLSNAATSYNDLAQTMAATEFLWNYQIQTINLMLPAGAQRNQSEWTRTHWAAMLIISPEVSAKADFTIEQCKNDPDFDAKNYVHRGLALIRKQCDAILSQ